jgi:hypothetical protein
MYRGLLSGLCNRTDCFKNLVKLWFIVLIFLQLYDDKNLMEDSSAHCTAPQMWIVSIFSSSAEPTHEMSVLWNIIVSSISFVILQLWYNIENSDTWVRSHYWIILRYTNGYTHNQVSLFACCVCLTWYSLVPSFTLATPCLPVSRNKVFCVTFCSHW